MKGNLIMRKSLGFTLAEVLITLAIIGVVAAMTIPSVIVNTNQSEYKTGLKKAVSVLNSSITMNVALEGETPYDNNDLFNYLQQHMSVMKTTDEIPFAKENKNLAFYTTDGMRFEVPAKDSSSLSKMLTLHESGTSVMFNGNDNVTGNTNDDQNVKSIGNCGSMNLSVNPNDTTKSPCLIAVDVNGDRKPNPANIQLENNNYSWPGPQEKLLKDVFSIMITDEKAVPFGVTAQKAMYQAQHKK